MSGSPLLSHSNDVGGVGLSFVVLVIEKRKIMKICRNELMRNKRTGYDYSCAKHD